MGKCISRGSGGDFATSRVAGNAAHGLTALAAEAPASARLVLLTSFVLPYLSKEEEALLTAQIDEIARARHVDWVILQGPVGGLPRVLPESVPKPPEPVDVHPHDAAICLVSYRDGRRHAALLGVGHPHGRSVRWL
jgi:hypothetical protein